MYPVPDQTGRLALVTDAESGRGKEVARRLSRAGATVVLATRHASRGEQARQDILAETPRARLRLCELDLADLSSIRWFADEFVSGGRPLDVLVNNSSVAPPATRTTSADGFELQLASCVLGPFALTVRLLPLLLAAPAARVTTMTSGAALAGRVRFDDLQWERRRYNSARCYAQVALADLLLAQHLARLAESRRWRLTSTAAHPGCARALAQTSGTLTPPTGLTLPTAKRPKVRRKRFLPSPDIAACAEPLLFAAVDPAALNGGYYGPAGTRFGLAGQVIAVPLPARAQDAVTAGRLWETAEELTGARVDAEQARPVRGRRSMPSR